jgi:hypothetical protein
MKWYLKLYIKFIKCFIVPCEHASLLLTKKEFDKLTFRETINLRMHMIKCKYCRWFEKEDALLTHTILNHQHKIDKDSLPFTLAPEKLEEIKSKL